jgi:hypothetical protein
MGSNKRRMASERKAAADKEAVARRALKAVGRRRFGAPSRNVERVDCRPNADAILPDDRRSRHRPALVFWVRCPACRTTNSVDLRKLDWHRDAAWPHRANRECVACRVKTQRSRAAD